MGGLKTITTGKGAMRFKYQQNACSYHPLKSIELLCEVCMELVCVECIPIAHNGHTFVSLREITPLKRHEIHDFMNITEAQMLAEIKQRILSTSGMFEQDGSGCDDLESYLEKQSGSLTSDLDILRARRISLYRKSPNMEIRPIYSCKMGTLPEDLLRYLQKYQSVDKAVNMNSIVTSGCTPHKFQQNDDGHALDSLTDGILQGTCLSDGAKFSEQIGTPSVGYVPKHQLSFCRSALPLQYTVLPETNTLQTFKSPRKISQICITGDMAWTLFNDKVTLLDKTGEIKQQRIYDVPVRAILLHPLTRQLYTFDYHGIIDLTTGARILYFQLTTEPMCLKFGRDGCILIGMSGKIGKFLSDGTHILTTKVSASGLPFVFTPDKITECPLTGNVAFVDLDLPKDGGQGERHVQVMTKEFQEDIRLRVETSAADGTISNKGHNGRCDIEYDKGGNLLLVDGRNIFLMNMKTEKVIRTIHTDKYPVTNIGLGGLGELWVTLHGKSNKVKVLEYIEDHSG